MGAEYGHGVRKMFKKEKIKELQYTIVGELKAADIEKKSDEILLKYGEKTKISGFRPGHIPVAVLRQRYGTEAAQDAINAMMNADLDAFVSDKKIKLAGSPKADLTKFVVGGDAEYSLMFEILPELPKIDLEKFTLAKKVAIVTDGDIEKTIENIRSNRSEFQKQDAEYKLTAGDIAIIDFTGYLGEKKFDGGEGKNHNLKLGGGQFIPGFEDQVIGHKANDEFDVNVTFPKEYHSAELAGKAVRFAVKVKEARHPILPDVDEKFAKEIGMESVEKMREEIKNILTKQNEENAQTEMRNALLEILNDKVKLPLPVTLVEQELSTAKKDAKEFDEKKERKEAERRVKLGLILAEWGSQNNIKVSQGELQSAIWTEASRYPNPEEVYDFYNKNQGALSMLNGILFERKTLDAMIEKCKIK